MLISEALLTREEFNSLKLRELYSSAGCERFRLSGFEPFDLYMRYRDFLMTDRIVSFTDGDGRLLALKPDVTLSIIRSCPDHPDSTRRVYYDEQVYRASGSDKAITEIHQSGVEFMGVSELRERAELIRLACRALDLISKDSLLDLSHLDYLSAFLATLNIAPDVEAEILRFIRGKNRSALTEISRYLPLNEGEREAFLALMQFYRPFREQVPLLQRLSRNEAMTAAVTELETVFEILQKDGFERRVSLDFSLLNDMSYYNGLIFQGFTKEIPSAVLHGGQYDRLMKKMGKDAGAIGFSINLNRLSRMRNQIPAEKAQGGRR